MSRLLKNGEFTGEFHVYQMNAEYFTEQDLQVQCQEIPVPEQEQDEPVSEPVLPSFDLVEPVEIEPLELAELADSVLEESRRESEQILAKAEQRSSEMLEEAKEQAKQTCEAAYRAGYHEGKQAAAAEAEALLEELKSLIGRLDSEKYHLLEQYEADIKKLALAIASKVLDEKVETDGELLKRQFKKAVQDIKHPQWVKLTVSKHEAVFATENSEYLLSLARSAEHIEVVVSEDAPAGTCIVETAEGITDTSISTQYRLLETAFISA